MGVVAAITPWNFPLLLAVWKIAPALLAGNTMVLKPSPFTPLSSLKLGEVLRDVLPPGVLNVVTGGDELGAWMTGHEVPRKISFTGSVATGKYTALLLEAFGDRLLFPAEFVGRGDMSRGGLLLRAVRANAELEYTQVRGAVVHGRRPPRLEGRGRHRADDGRKASRPRLRR